MSLSYFHPIQFDISITLYLIFPSYSMLYFHPIQFGISIQFNFIFLSNSIFISILLNFIFPSNSNLYFHPITHPSILSKGFSSYKYICFLPSNYQPLNTIKRLPYDVINFEIDLMKDLGVKIEHGRSDFLW